MEWRQNISKEIFERKYCLEGESSTEEVFNGVATEIASVEKTEEDKIKWKDIFYNELNSGKLMPGGRILANARPNSSLKNYNNCFTIDIEDSMEGIYNSLLEDATISKAGGGVGFNISKVRPKGDKLSKGGESSGPLSFLRVFNESAKIIMTGGQRRCLPKGTSVSLKTGLETIENVKVGDEVLTSKGYFKVTDLFTQGVQETIIIETQNGNFECTPNHKMPVLDSIDTYYWKEAKDLVQGDRVVFVAKEIEGSITSLPSFNYIRPPHSTTCKDITIPELDENIAWFFGFLHGNGHVRVDPNRRLGRVQLSCSTMYQESINKSIKTLKRFGIQPTVLETQGNWVNVTVYSYQLSLYLSQFKTPNTSISIPELIKKGTVDIRSAYLAGLFDSDGSYKTRPLCAVVTVYPEFAKEIITLYASLGISTSTRICSPKEENWKDKVHIKISNTKAIGRFISFVAPYSSKFKNTRKNSFIGKGRYDNNFPSSFWRNNTRYKSSKLINISGKTITLSTIERVLEEELSLVPVLVNKLSDGRNVETFDIEVDTVHEFVSNGFLTHNSAHICIMNVDHPDIEEFITIKQGDSNKELTQFNISVGITDAFMEAVSNDTEWNLVFEGKVYKTVRAKELYDLIAKNAFIHNEPGVLFMDEVERYNNGSYAFKMDRSNPCITGDGLVLTPRGYVRADSLNEGDKVITKNNTIGVIKTKEVNTFREVIYLAFSNGRSLKATHSHIFYTDGKEIQVKDIKIGDFIDGLNNEIIKIVDKYIVDGLHTVYDFFEETTDSWITEGVVSRGCGEIVMPPYSLCCLASLNLTKFVKNPFTPKFEFDFSEFVNSVTIAVRFLDNVLEATDYPLDRIEDFSKLWRRVGLGFTGLGDVFTMAGNSYGDENSIILSERIACSLRDSSYLASTVLSKERGPFPSFNKDLILNANFIKLLPLYIQENIAKYGLRNIGLNTCAPTGTISLSIGQNCSSGIEPMFSLQYNRNIRTGRGDETTKEMVYDYAWLKYCELYPDADINHPPKYFVTTLDIDPYKAVDVQAVFQKYIDHSISKTANLPLGYTFEQYKDLWTYAFKSGLKGFTSFNPEGSIKPILEHKKEEEVEIGSTNRPPSIDRHHAPKRPDALPCAIYEIVFNKEKYIVTVGTYFGSIYEIFLVKNDDATIDTLKHKEGTIKKIGKSKYNLLVKDGEEHTVIEDIAKHSGSIYGSLGRMISMALRHGTPLEFIVKTLQKSTDFYGFEKVVARVLKKYIIDGEKVLSSERCPQCGHDLIFKEGCMTCPNDGWSKCS